MIHGQGVCILKNKLALLAAFCAMAALIMSTAEVISCCRSALSLCLELILPSLFPFFVVSGLLNRLGLPGYMGKLLSPAAERLFNVSGAGASAFFIGITGGYPMGASYIADMHEQGQISAEEASRLLAFCNNSGPAFIIGAVGAGVFRSAAAGLLLYFVHIAAAMLTGIILRPKAKLGRSSNAAAPRAESLKTALPASVEQSVVSSLNVCGFVVCFTVLTGLLDAWGLFSVLSGLMASQFGVELSFARAALKGILELGSAVGAMQGLTLAPMNLSLASAVLGWGGISVHLQTAAVLSDSEINTAPHFAGRLISSAIGAALSYFLSFLLLK